MLPRELNRPLTRRDVFPTLLSFFVGLIFAGILLKQNYPSGLFLCAFILSYAVGVVLHEAGHAGAALAMGGTVDYVRIGAALGKRPPWKVRYGGLDWYIYNLPFSGSVHSTLYTVERYRLRRCFIIAAGPLVNVLLLVPGAAFLYFTPFDSKPAILLGWMIANGILLAYSVPPRMVQSYGRLTPNDGLNFWRTLHQGDDEIRQIVENADTVRLLAADAATAQQMSVDELLARHEADPANVAFLWYLSEKLQKGNDARYSTYVLQLIDHPRLPAKTATSLIDGYLTWQLHRGPPERPEFADQLSQRLLKAEDAISTRGTRGSVLVDIGRVAEGKAMLQEVLEKTKSSFDKSYSHIFLALAYETEGDLDNARAHALLAKEIDPHCAALGRIANLLNPAK